MKYSKRIEEAIKLQMSKKFFTPTREQAVKYLKTFSPWLFD